MYNGAFRLEKDYEKSQIDLNALRSATALEGAARTLMRYETHGAIYEVDKEGIALISDLEEGVYLIHSFEGEESEMIPTLVFVPTWMESEGVMLHDITIIPKVEKPLQMGDTSEAGAGFLLIASFLTILLVYFYRKHLRKRKNCDTILKS